VTGMLGSLLPRSRRARGWQAADTGGAGGAFQILGLEVRDDLTDDDVHAAWRRIASATHPDREDGGDPPRFARAAAAYTALRTRSARGEALADLRATPPPARRAAASPAAGPAQRGAARALPGRVIHGRPVRLVLRILIAAAASVGAVLAAGPHPAAPALVTGIATWLVVTARHDLAPAEPREPGKSGRAGIGRI
jgi:curved DNA-binding protein CbpA